MNRPSSRVTVEERGSKGAGEIFSPLLPHSLASLRIILLVVLLFAFALRLARLGDLLLWGDEGFSVFSASRDLASITLDTTSIDPHPPLYYYLLHVYFLLVGRAEFVLRFFSVFFGTATVALAWASARRMFDARTGALAAFVTAMAPFAVHYSQEVRMYALAMFLTALGVYLFVRLSERETRALWLGYAAAMLLALFTLYHTALVFLAIGLVLLTQWRARRAFVVRWFGVSCGIVALFLPWLVFRYASAYTGIREVAGDAVPMDVATFVARGFAAIAVGTTIPLAHALALAAAYVALLALALVLARRAHIAKIHDALLVSLVVVPIVAYYPLYLLMPLYRGRLFALACVPLALLLARSAAILLSRARPVSLLLALVVVGASAYSLGNYHLNYNRYSATVEDYLPLIRTVEQRAQAGDAVLFHAHWQQGYFLTYYRGAPLEYGALDRVEDLSTAVATSRRVWAIVQALPRHDAEIWLAQHAFLLGEEKYGQTRLLAYLAGAPARGETLATPAQFDNSIALLGYRLNDAPIESGGGIVTLQLDWQAARNVADDYAVSVRLTNLRGDVTWARADALPASGTLPTRAWQPNQVVHDRHVLRVPTGMPPGAYALRVAMIATSDDRVANVLAPANRRGESLALTNISIAKPTGRTQAALVPAHALDAPGGEVALVGFALDADEIGAGETVPITLYWRAEQKPTRDYVATIRLVDAAGVERVKARQRPANDAFPTRAWDTGEVWLDKIALAVPAETMPGEARVLVTLADESSGETFAPEILVTRVWVKPRVR